MTQKATILELLQNRPEGITPLDALRWAGCLRLAARISDLRREGHRIETVIEDRHARYRLA